MLGSCVLPQEDTPAEALEAISAELGCFDDWTERYRYISEIGQSLPPFSEAWQNEENRFVGCQSQVWLKAFQKDGKFFFAGTSDASIVKGLIALLLRVYSGRTAQEIRAVDPSFLKELGLTGALSANRSNGLASMVKAIERYAS